MAGFQLPFPPDVATLEVTQPHRTVVDVGEVRHHRMRVSEAMSQDRVSSAHWRAAARGRHLWISEDKSCS